VALGGYTDQEQCSIVESIADYFNVVMHDAAETIAQQVRPCNDYL